MITIDLSTENWDDAIDKAASAVLEHYTVGDEK